MSVGWFAIIHGESRTRFSHLFATSTGHPVLRGAGTACGEDAYARFPGVFVSFAVVPEAEQCATCAQKEQEWNGSSDTDQTT